MALILKRLRTAKGDVEIDKEKNNVVMVKRL